MPARYKLRSKVAEDGSGIVLVTLQRETNIYISNTNIAYWTNLISEFPDAARDTLEATLSMTVMLERNPLGLESDWKHIPQSTADLIIDRFYDNDNSFRIHFEGNVGGGRVVIGVGRATIAVSVAAGQVESEIQKIEALKTICAAAEANGEDPNAWANAAEGTIQGGLMSYGIYETATACAAGAARGGGGLAAAFGCIVGILGALFGLSSMAKDAQNQQELESLKRVRDSACDKVGEYGGIDLDTLDRYSRTA